MLVARQEQSFTIVAVNQMSGARWLVICLVHRDTRPPPLSAYFAVVGAGRYAYALMSDVTFILTQISQGDAHAAEELLPLVYAELRRLAAQKLASETPGQTLDATGLVHEAYLRLVARGRDSSQSEQYWEGRGHFFAAAAEAMRRILIERARRKHRQKHGGTMRRLDIDVSEMSGHMPDEDLLALDEALNRLKAQDSSKAQLVQLRFFAGLSNEEAAKILGISSATAKRNWRYARAWLHREISNGENRAAR